MEAISRLRNLQRQYEDRQRGVADAAERDRREDIRLELGDRRDALREQLDLEMQALDARREQLDAERDAVQEVFDQRLGNAALYAEARLVLERGVSEQLLADLWAFEKEFGEGMGILGEYVKTRLVQQLIVANEALQELAHNVRAATDQSLLESLMGRDLAIRDIFAEMFDVASLDGLVSKINEAIMNIDVGHIRNQMKILAGEFNRLADGNFDLSSRNHASAEQIRGSGWDEDAFHELSKHLEDIQRRHTDLWLSMQDSMERFALMSDEGLFSFIEQQFGTIPDAARDAIAEALRMLGDGQTTLQEAIESIFLMPLDNANDMLGTSLSRLSREQLNAIEEWERLSIAYAEATAEADRARILAEKERLALAQEWFRDAQSGAWYLDTEKTRELLEVIEEIKNAQIAKIETLMGLHEDDFNRFNEAQQKKLLSVRRFHDEALRSSGNLFENLSANMQRWVNNVGSVLKQIGQAIVQLTAQMQVITDIAAEVQAVVGQTQSKVDVIASSAPGATANVVSVPRFASGGLNRGAGFRFLDPNEQVLTAEQTRAFSDLVFGLGSDGMRNIADTLQRASLPGANLQGRSMVEANFNFNAGVTQEALPEVKKLIGIAVHELKGQIPNIVATEQRGSLSRMRSR